MLQNKWKDFNCFALEIAFCKISFVPVEKRGLAVPISKLGSLNDMTDILKWVGVGEPDYQLLNQPHGPLLPAFELPSGSSSSTGRSPASASHRSISI